MEEVDRAEITSMVINPREYGGSVSETDIDDIFELRYRSSYPKTTRAESNKHGCKRVAMERYAIQVHSWKQRETHRR